MIQDAFQDPETGDVVYWVDTRAGEEPDTHLEESSDSGDSTSSDDTITSSEARDFFYELKGRLFVDSPDVPLWFPSDDLRMSALIHQTLKMVHGGNYFGPMYEVLRPRGDYRPRVLDMCTRDGSWVQEMSQEFPDVEFVSLDIAPMAHHVPRKNVVFEVYDIQNELLEPNNSFDVVRMSFVTLALKDMRRLVEEVQRVLKPGGLLCMIEPEIAFYDAKDITQPSRSTPRACMALEAMNKSLRLQGVQPDIWADMANWLTPDSGLWSEYSGILPPFERITKGVKVLYAGGWDGDFRRQEIRLLMAQLHTVWLRSLAPMLSTTKMSEWEISQLLDGAVEELRDLRTAYAIKLHHVFAYKPRA